MKTFGATVSTTEEPDALCVAAHKMRENCTSGTVRGVYGNRDSYRKRVNHTLKYGLFH